MGAHGPLNFRQRDIKAAVNAVLSLGQKVASVTIQKDGSFTVHVGDANIAPDGATTLPSRKRNRALEALRE